MDQRASERYVVDLELKGTLEARKLRACVYDLSMDGCMIEAEGTPLPERGQSLQLIFPQGIKVAGTLAWASNRNAGVQFSQRLNAAVVADLAFKPDPQRRQFVDQFGRNLPGTRTVQRG